MEAYGQQTANQVPTIKCSTCDKDIDLGLIAEHVCLKSPAVFLTSASSSVPAIGQPMRTNASALSRPSPPPVPADAVASLPPRGASLLRPQRPKLAKIDPGAAGPVMGELTPASSGHGSLAASPVSTASGRTAPWKAPRKNIMIPRGPPSPELTNLDCAFPPFPMAATRNAKEDKKPRKDHKTGKGRSETPTQSRSASAASYRQRSKSNVAGGSEKGVRPSTAAGSQQETSKPLAVASDPSMVPPLPITLAAANTIHPPLVRADTAPAYGSPSELQSGNTDELQVNPAAIHRSESSDRQISQYLPSGRTASTKEPMYKSKRPPPIVSDWANHDEGLNLGKMRSPNMPTPGSARSLGRTLTNKLFGRRRSPSTSSHRSIVRNALSDEPDNSIPTPPLPSSAFESPRIAPGTPAMTEFSLSPASAPPSAPLPAPPAEVVDHEPEEEREASLIVLEGNHRGETGETTTEYNSQLANNAAAVQFDFDWNHLSAGSPAAAAEPDEAPLDANVDRASIRSASSYASIEYTERTISSRTTPPSLDDLHKSVELSHIDVASNDAIEIPAPLRPRNPEPIPEQESDRLSDDRTHCPIDESESDDTTVPHSSMEEDAPSPKSASRPARKDSLASGSKTTGPQKGMCRGCTKPIMAAQKSVSSADGRLTGRYHKECFVCYTCKSPFPTAEFYVHADHPYCGHHYHQLENSLCATCGKGIEGLYMETANVAGRGKEKHHPECLKCTTCRIQLTDDYFELSGKVYCERDAFRLASFARAHNRGPARPSPLVREYIRSGEPSLMKGSNFPERRLNKMMTPLREG